MHQKYFIIQIGLLRFITHTFFSNILLKVLLICVLIGKKNIKQYTMVIWNTRYKFFFFHSILSVLFWVSKNQINITVLSVSRFVYDEKFVVYI